MFHLGALIFRGAGKSTWRLLHRAGADGYTGTSAGDGIAIQYRYCCDVELFSNATPMHCLTAHLSNHNMSTTRQAGLYNNLELKARLFNTDAVRVEMRCLCSQ